MARSGLYKSDVSKARLTLLAQNKHPSVDAVRVALGNTGSKTTIHKYLKEIDEEDGGNDDRRTSISETLQDLVARLAAQLQAEANASIDVIRAQSAASIQHHVETAATLQKEFTALSAQLQRTETTALQEKAAHDKTREALQSESVARHTLEQHLVGLKDRLAENEKHRQSLEEKHQHAREALEHYRQSVKEQREQDQRRQEQQVQQLQAEIRQLQQSLIVKQDDLTRLSQEGARLVSDLSHARKAFLDEQSQVRQLQPKLEALPRRSKNRLMTQRCRWPRYLKKIIVSNWHWQPLVRR
jgi:ACT domain-containing protein